MSEQDFKVVCSKIDKEKELLNSISQDIWKKPELKFEEIHAHDVLTNALTKYGFCVQKSYLLPTAFRAQHSSGDGPTIAILLEYDALPGIGHACGHNLIAEAGLAAVIGVKAAMEADQSLKGKIVALGTPAEETGGGKVKLINKGAFDDIDVAMMVHPSPLTDHDPTLISRLSLSVEYKGKEAHAGAYPWEGVNALDAAVGLYQSLGLLRQQLKPSIRLHAIITKGGVAINIIPAASKVEINIRAPNRKELQLIRTKVENCVEGAGKSTGCTHTIVWDEENRYEDLVTNKTMRDVFAEFLTKLGLPAADKSGFSVMPVGSTDMGNVSYVVPSIHPLYSISTQAINHTKEFTTAAGSTDAQEPTLAAAKAMALTALSLMRDSKKIKQAKAEFEKQFA